MTSGGLTIQPGRALRSGPTRRRACLSGEHSRGCVVDLHLHYNAESETATVAGYTYTYDGDGNRVERFNGTAGTIFWYGAGTGIHAEARFYEGLKLPPAFKTNGVQPAHGLRSVLNSKAPHIPTARATPPVIRNWNP